MPSDLATTTTATSDVTATGGDAPRIRAVLALLKNAGEAKLLFDASGSVAFAAGSTDILFGLATTALSGRRGNELPAGIGQPLVHLAHQAFVSGVGAASDVVVTSTDGGPVLVNVRTSPMVENGSVLGVGVTLFDLASRRVLEAAIRSDLAKALEAAGQSPLGVFFLDARGHCIAVSGRWERVTAVPASAAHGQGWLAMVAPEALDAFRRVAVVAHRNKEGWRTQFMRAGHQGMLDAAAAPVTDANGTILGYVGFLTPATGDAEQAPTAAAPAASAPSTVPPAPAAPAASAPTPQATPTPPIAPPIAVPEILQGVNSAALTQAPVQPVERYRLPTIEGSEQWQPPKLAEGYTPASRLSTERVEEIEITPVPVEPGTDKVTGLPNRLLFAQHVQATIDRMKTDALTVAVSFIDLQGIRAQRASAGRRVANDSLFLLAKRLESTIRSIEIAGAISEDIFGVLSINWLFAEDLPIVCRRLLGRLEEPLAGRDGEFVVDMRLGMSVARPGDTVEMLFARAVQALGAAASSPDRYAIEGL